MEAELNKKTAYQFQADRILTIQPETYSAVIRIGNWHIQLKDKTFTEEQIKNMREFFGWEVENLCESQSEI